MVKAYLRYAEEASWGVIVSSAGNVLPHPNGNQILAPALDTVCVWSMKRAAVEMRLRPAASTPAEVTAMAMASESAGLAVGYGDGTIRLWQLDDGSERVAFNGHRSAVAALRFSPDASVLASGGNDTNVVLWDVVGETGICKLRGHRGAVNDVRLLEGGKSLATVSKDGVLKLWDVHTQHCVQTVVVPSGELWSLDVHEAAGRLLTGGAGGELLLWSLEHKPLVEPKRNGDSGVGPTPRPLSDRRSDAAAAAANASLAGTSANASWTALHATMLGGIETPSGARVVSLRFNSDWSCVAVQFADKNLLLLGVQDAAQLKRQLRRRVTKKRKQAADADADDDPDGAAEAADAPEMSPLAAFQPLSHLRAPHKLHSFAFLPVAAGAGAGGDRRLAKGGGKPAGTRPTSARLLVAQRNNQVSVWECELKQRGACEQIVSLDTPGHRQEPRCVALSSDERSLLSVADGEAKVWSLSSGQCLRILSCGCATFVLSGRFVLVGTKAGSLQLFSMATGDLVHEVQAHTGAVWALSLLPGATAVLSASADESIATWIPTPLEDGTAQLDADRTHQMSDDVMCAQFSPDGRCIAAGLLDASIKVLFVDTFKLKLTLFGHKLPVLSLSVSSDGALLISGSADKSVKIWGLDFGDCHRSLFAHGESVTCVQFVKNTHYFFSCGKDKLIKYWDADSFELVLILRSHLAEVWSLAVSRQGGFFVSASRDRSIRLWRRTEEQVFIEEEREVELDAVFEGGVEKQQQAAEAEEEEAATMGLEGFASEGGSAGRRTIESVKGAERVLEALRVLDEEDERRAEHAVALEKWQVQQEAAKHTSSDVLLPKEPVLVPNLLLLGLTPGDYLLKALGSVRSAELDQALMLLPFEAVERLLTRILPLLESAGPVELLARCVLFLLRLHHKQVVANQSLLTLLHPLDTKLRQRVCRERDLLGYNMAALRYVQQVIEQNGANGKLFEATLTERASRESNSTAELRRRTAARERAAPRRIK